MLPEERRVTPSVGWGSAGRSGRLREGQGPYRRAGRRSVHLAAVHRAPPFRGGRLRPLVHPFGAARSARSGAVIEPYDRSLVDVGAGERQAWAKEVLRSIDDRLGNAVGMVFEIHAGAAYRDFGLVHGLHARGAEVVNPTAGLSQGQQLAFYAGSLEPRDERRPSPSTSRTNPVTSGYSPLGVWLAARADRRVRMPFVDLERLLGRPLPASARRHRPWWGNNDRSPQAKAWLSAGWRVATVDLAGGHVTFQKAAS
jgi:hypothetical protein